MTVFTVAGLIPRGKGATLTFRRRLPATAPARAPEAGFPRFRATAVADMLPTVRVAAAAGALTWRLNPGGLATLRALIGPQRPAGPASHSSIGSFHRLCHAPRNPKDRRLRPRPLQVSEALARGSGRKEACSGCSGPSCGACAPLLS